MKNCTYRLGLDELLNAPMGLLTLQGSDGEDDSDKSGSDADKDAKDKKDDKSDESGDGDDKSKGDDKKPVDQQERVIAGLKEERDRHQAKRSEAEQKLKEANAEIAKLKKDGTPDDALKQSNDELTTSNAKLTEVNQKLMLENAFLKEAGFDWVDPEAALRLADLSGVEYDEKTNKAIGLKSALAALAKEKSYLLKPKADEDDDKDDKDKKPRRTGQAPRGGTQKEADQAAREAKLRNKYPAIRR